MEAAAENLGRWQKGVFWRVALIWLVLSALALEGQELIPTKPSDQKSLLEHPFVAWGPDYTNWLELSIGSFFVDGNEAAFQQRQQVRGDIFGGIESLHFEQQAGTNSILRIDGRGIFDNHDYDLRLDYSVEERGYVRAGFNENRYWYNRSGGYYPPTRLWITPFKQEVWIDRGEAWLEAGLRRPEVPELTFRYSHQYREGDKDSTAWGDINTATNGIPKNIVPSFFGIDEKRDIFLLAARHTISQTELSGAVSYERTDQENSHYILRQPGQANERFVTQDDNLDGDLFNAHVSGASRINDRLLFTSAYAFTLLETDMSGSRIYGAGFDAVFDPTFRRQLFDEGFLNLDGDGTWHEHLFTANLQYTPSENFSILPSLRVASLDESVNSSFLLTSLSPPAPGTAISDPTVGANDREYIDVAESLEARYTGLTNWVFYARGELSQDQGDRREIETDLTTAESEEVDQDIDRFTQKYSAGANWYPLRRLNLAAQYYHKIRDYDYDSNLGAPPANYPGFIQDQSFETDDVNFRISVRPITSLSLVTRYDFQLSSIDTGGDSLGEVQSAKVTSHIIGQNISWNPIPRLILSGAFDYVIDRTHTPANDLTGAAANLVLESRNDYWNASALVGYALTEKSDLQFQYFYYRADNYRNNAPASVPYDSGAQENGVTATLIHKFSRSLRWTLKYGFFNNRDELYGGNNDYDAHLIYSSLQYRF